MRLVAIFPDRRHLLQVGQDILDHPCPDVVADPAGGDIDHPHRRFDEVQLRQHAELVGKYRAADDRMEKRRMDRVHRIFQDLQPVARIEVFLARNEPKARPAEAVVYRERRLPVGRPQIGKDDAVVLVGRISPVIEPILEGALRRLAGCLEDRPVRREQPSVIAAAYPFGVDQPELQRRAPMRAVQFE